MERAIVFSKTTNLCPNYEWFNQINVASGLLKGANEKRTAIDLLRRSRQDQSRLDIVELKEWGSSNNPFHAAYELFRYFRDSSVISTRNEVIASRFGLES
jgi:hypothetical protein